MTPRRQTVDEALAVEEERAVRDQFRDGDWSRLVAVELLDQDPDVDPIEACRSTQAAKILAAYGTTHPGSVPDFAPLLPVARRTSRTRLVAEALLIGIVLAAAIALVWAAQRLP